MFLLLLIKIPYIMLKNKQSLLFYISICLTTLLFSAVIAISVLINKQETDENRFNVLSKQIEKSAICDENTLKELSQQRFKEDYYISQESNNTTLILSVFGIVVILFGLFSFSIFESRINEYKAYYNNKIGEQDNKYKILKKDFENLFKEISSKEGYENEQKANDAFNDGNFDWYVYYVLSSIKFFSDYYCIIKSRENTESLSGEVIKQQIEKLEKTIKKLENEHNIKDLSPTVTHSYIQDIQRFNSVEISKLVSKLYSKISN